MGLHNLGSAWVTPLLLKDLVHAGVSTTESKSPCRTPNRISELDIIHTACSWRFTMKLVSRREPADQEGNTKEVELGFTFKPRQARHKFSQSIYPLRQIVKPMGVRGPGRCEESPPTDGPVYYSAGTTCLPTPSTHRHQRIFIAGSPVHDRRRRLRYCKTVRISTPPHYKL